MRVLKHFGAFVLALAAMPLAAQTVTPANKGASRATAAVYQYLADLPGRPGGRVISGQETGNASPVTNVYSATQGYGLYISSLERATGSLVGLAGFDYSVDPTPSYHFPQLTSPGVLDAVNTVALDHWSRGGLVTVMFGANNPWTGGWSNDTSTGGKRITDAITPGTAAYAKWMAQLDAVAAGLAKLREAGVVVLWRPLHEMNGRWFWWGSPVDPQDYKDLWRHMFDYFTRVKGLDNLLWVYAASSGATNASSTVTLYYPGDGFVDIVGLDAYRDSIDAQVVPA